MQIHIHITDFIFFLWLLTFKVSLYTMQGSKFYTKEWKIY